MKAIFSSLLCAVLAVGVANGVCNCGCLQCNKQLRVVSAPSSPVQIIVRGQSYLPKNVGYSIQRPLSPNQNTPTLYSYAYNIQPISLQSPQSQQNCRRSYGTLGYNIQVPYYPNNNYRNYMNGLVAQPDRIVMNAPGEGAQCNQAPQSHINIQPLSALDEDLDDEDQQIYYRVPNTNSCPCNKRYSINIHPSQSAPQVTLNELLRSKRSPSSKFLQALQRNKRHLLPPPRSDLLQQLFLNLKPLAKAGKEQNLNQLVKESGQNEVDADEEEEILLKPLNINALVPETTAVYILNTPIRFLNQARQFKDYIYPIMECLPRIIRNTNKYFHSFMSDLTRKRHRFMGNFVSDLDLIREIEEPMYEPVYPKFRNKRSVDAPNDPESFAPEYTTAHENLDDDIRIYSSQNPVRQVRNVSQGSQSPKLITDDRGCVYVEINGVKKLLTSRPAFSERAGVQNLTSIDDLAVKDKISHIIELAKAMSDRPNREVDVARTEGNILVVKEAISKALDRIQSLINLDINQDIDIIDHVRKLKVLKTGIAREWYQHLLNHKINDITLKIEILDRIRQMQRMKQNIFMNIVQRLQGEDDFNWDVELEMLEQLDDLQGIIDRIVDELGVRIQFRGKFDLKAELEFVQELVNVKLITERTPTEIGKKVKAKRDEILDKQIHLLEGLKTVLDENDFQTIDKEIAIIQHTGHLQTQKLRLVKELDASQMEQSAKIKVLMNLQRQIDFLNTGHVFSKIPQGTTSNRIEDLKKEFVGGEQMGAADEEIKLLHRDDDTNPKTRSSRPKNMRFPVFKFPSRSVSKIIVEDKTPVQFVSNGYVLTAYKNEN